ncbi:hypothetical protein Pla108_07850 [Botrimarina colliarenosi]|uniref:Glycosyltransferase RgtA/B/C/D-like domain-containing protein n=1 Tax=Botrimarina colliarenosi TaxID=2528001 RepID=A0A5C6AIG0_9BACT|nr:hypothetical protein [Botrimarina colliarenosi]TWT99842.1 hypothetical protein Pla108_07850 [Botrimarina colliarenosi]
MNPSDAAASPNLLSPARRDYQVFRRLVIALLVVACAGPLSLNVVDPDLWGHVRYAEEWIAQGELPRTATHTFTAQGHPWVNHENLAELALAYGFRTLGVQGMLAAKVLLGMSILLLMSLAARRQGVRPIAAWATFLLVAHNLQAFFPLRPQLLSFLWCAVMLLALDRAFAGWGNRRSDFQNNRRKADLTAIDWRWLAGMPLLFVVWANSHAGFAAGLGIFTVVLVGRAVELLIRTGREAWRPVVGLAVVAAACGLATLATPYGYSLHLWLIESLGSPRPEITEWAAPTSDNPVFWPLVLLIAVALAAYAFTDRRRDLVKMLVLALVGWQAVSHLRHIAFFALLCGFWLPPHLQSIASRLRSKAAQGLPTASLSPWMRTGIAAALAGAIALQATFLGQRLASLPVYRSRYPVDALQWMAEQHVRGDLVVCFNWAQYALAALAPDVKVSFDGRFRTCYPQQVIDRHFDFLVGGRIARHRSGDSGPIDGLRTLEVDRPDWVLVDRKYANAVEVMADAGRANGGAWTLVYQDAVAQLWGPTAVVDDVSSPNFVPAERRFVSDHFSLTAFEWPALPRRRVLAPVENSSREVAKRDASAPAVPYNEG